MVYSVTIDLTLPPNIDLGYLRGPILGRWEAQVRQPLPCDPTTVRYAIGLGCAFHPDHAITYALLALERDPQLVEQALVIPTCAPPDDLANRLTNLLTPSTITLSPPKFRLKA